MLRSGGCVCRLNSLNSASERAPKVDSGTGSRAPRDVRLRDPCVVCRRQPVNWTATTLTVRTASRVVTPGYTDKGAHRVREGQHTRMRAALERWNYHCMHTPLKADGCALRTLIPRGHAQRGKFWIPDSRRYAANHVSVPRAIGARTAGVQIVLGVGEAAQGHDRFDVEEADH